MYFAVLSLTVLSLLRQVTSLAPTPGTNEPVAAAWYTGWHATGGRVPTLSRQLVQVQHADLLFCVSLLDLTRPFFEGATDYPGQYHYPERQ
jgi:hypothetical protein